MPNPPSDDAPQSRQDKFSELRGILLSIVSIFATIVAWALIGLAGLSGALWLLGRIDGVGNGPIFSSAIEQGAVMIGLAVTCFLILVVVIVALARILAWGNLQHHPHALGLPAGSVRAVIALAFLVFLAVMSIFGVQTAQGRFVNLGLPVQERHTATGDNPSADEIAEIKEGLQARIRNELSQRADDSRPWRVEFGDLEQDGNVFVLSGTFQELVDRSEANELSREILTIIATALTAIVGFYFGSRSLADGVGQVTSDTSEAAQLELTLRRTRDRLRQLVGPDSIAQRKLKGRTDGNFEAYQKRLSEAEATLGETDALLLSVNSTVDARREALQKCRNQIDDMQKLEAILNNEPHAPGGPGQGGDVDGAGDQGGDAQPGAPDARPEGP